MQFSCKAVPNRTRIWYDNKYALKTVRNIPRFQQMFNFISFYLSLTNKAQENKLQSSEYW